VGDSFFASLCTCGCLHFVLRADGNIGKRQCDAGCDSKRPNVMPLGQAVVEVEDLPCLLRLPVPPQIRSRWLGSFDNPVPLIINDNASKSARLGIVNRQFDVGAVSRGKISRIYLAAGCRKGRRC
jgi:hypothetical protein